MRYWGVLAGKIAAAGVTVPLLWWGIVKMLPKPISNTPFGQDLPYTLGLLGLWLICCGMAYAIYVDQRFRCRVCGRRLRVPIETGSWSRQLELGRPRLEYICVFGHGTLRVPEVVFASNDPDDWKQHEDMWKELFPVENSRPRR
jgi:hypothetical protein